MPTYVYKCEQCESTFERRQSFSDAPLATHDECGGPVRKLIVPAPVIFKGSGFYTTDYRGGTNGSSGANGSKTDSDNGETPKAESSKGENAKGENPKGENAKSESASAKSEKSEKTASAARTD